MLEVLVLGETVVLHAAVAGVLLLPVLCHSVSPSSIALTLTELCYELTEKFIR